MLLIIITFLPLTSDQRPISLVGCLRLVHSPVPWSKRSDSRSRKSFSSWVALAGKSVADGHGQYGPWLDMGLTNVIDKKQQY